MSAEDASGGEERQFGELLRRLFTDDEFVERLEQDPQAGLREVGVELDESDLARMEQERAEFLQREAAAPAAAPAVVVAVRVATSPGVRAAVASQAEVRVATVTGTIAERRPRADDLDTGDEDERT